MKINYCKHKCTLNTTPTTIPKNKKNDFNTSTKLKYAHHVRTSTFLNVYEGAPYDIVTQNVNNSTVKFNFKYIGKPNYYLVIITNKTNPTEINLNPGDLCLYRGCDLWHWREVFTQKWYLQSFLHYVNVVEIA